MGAGKLTLGKGLVRVVEGVDAKGRRAVHIFDGGYLQTAQIKPNTGRSPGPMGNTIGKIVPKTDPFGLKGLWDKWGEAVHLGLDVIGLIPGLGEVADGLNAAIYLAEGDVVNAALSAAAMIPVGGPVATAAKLAKKGVDAVQAAGKQTAKKASKEAAEQTGKKAGKKPPANGGKKGGNGKKKKKKGPCDHLRQGSGKGPYRGGAHNKTSKPTGDGKDSHHMPADDASPLAKKDGPAIQMDPKDHARTSSNGQMPGSIEYREAIRELIESNKWQDAIVKDIFDVRRVAREAGDPKKYNEAMLEMLEYVKCLEKHGFLK